MADHTSEVWFVTGANRGLGAAIAEAALEAGHSVVATARRPETITASLGTADNLLAVQLDVTDENQAGEAVAAAVEAFGAIDVLVNNAGYGQLGLFEETSLELIKKQFDTNTFGTMNVTRAALPVMRKQHSGHIFSLSSISGTGGGFGTGAYSASKFAVEGWMESLALEVAPFSITATIIEPGFFRTDFLDGSSVAFGDIEIDDYAEVSAAVRKFQDDMNHRQVGDPGKLAAAIVQLAKVENPPMRFVAGADALGLIETVILPKRLEDLSAWRDLSASLGTDGA